MIPDPFAIRAGEPFRFARPIDTGAWSEYFRRRCGGAQVSEALRWRDQGRWIGLTYAGLWERIRATSLALQQRGVRAGDHVVIVSRSRPEWVVADYAVLALGRWSARSTRASRMRGSSRWRAASVQG